MISDKSDESDESADERDKSDDVPEPVPVGRCLLWIALALMLPIVGLSMCNDDRSPLANGGAALVGCSGITAICAVVYGLAKLALNRVRRD